MPLNYLLHRHQVSLMRVAASGSPEARRAHQGFVAGYADRIAAIVGPAGATAAPLVRA